VGPPYFDFFFVPLTLGLMVAMGFAVFTRWKKTDAQLLLQKGALPVIISLVAGLILPLFLAHSFAQGISWASYSMTAVITLVVSFWVVTMSLEDLWDKLSNGGFTIRNLKKLSASYWGMLCAHIGIAVCALGVGLSSVYDVQKDLRMVPGDSQEVAGYEFHFDRLDNVQGPNYTASRGQISAYKNGQLISVLFPEKRNYSARNQVMTEADIDGSLSRDLYVSLGEPLKGDAWAIRLHVKPFVRCIWLGGIMISLGGLLAVMDKRYRRRRQQKSAVASKQGAVA
jgi:cytochrome c-type biogenesis protein CcmF